MTEFYSLESLRRFIPLAMGLGTGHRQSGFTVSQGARSFLSLLVVRCFSISSSGTKLRMLGLVHIVKTIKKLIGMIAGQFSRSITRSEHFQT